MKISQTDWKKYIAKLRAVSNIAADKVAKYMTLLDIESEEGMKALLEYAYAIAAKYGEGAASLACQMHEEVAAMSGVNIPAAEPAATATYGETVRAIKGKMFDTKDPETIGGVVGNLVKRAGADTTLLNAKRDGAEWAWIPSGDTCPFCLMLASNGWQRASKKVIKGNHADHIHSHCDCMFAIRFDGRMDVEGYDPDALYDEYINAGSTQSERINALRRQHYSANSERINAQKRAAYARRKSIDNGRSNGYNDSPANDELKRRYERDVEAGWISPLCGLDNYKKLFREIENKTVGLKVKGDTVITGQSEHFMTRVVGTSIDPARIVNNIYSITGIRPQGYRSNARSGVEVSDILEALQSGRASELRDENGKLSRRYIGTRCIVTVNPEKGTLIQCNPKR